MTILFTVAKTLPPEVDLVDLPIASDHIGDPSIEIDWDFLAAEGFEGKLGQTKVLPTVGGLSLVAVGVGPAKAVTPTVLRKAAAAVARAAGKRAHLGSRLLEALPKRDDASGSDRALAAAAIVEGITLASYVYNTQKSTAAPSRLTACTLIGSGKRLTAAVERAGAISEAVCWARDLVNTPPSQLTAPAFASQIEAVALRVGLGVRVLDKKAIEKAGLTGTLAVNRGSAVEPRFVELIYEPAGKAKATVALVGKGITFDTGGLNLKTYEGMLTMKNDMGGAAAVAAAMSALPAVAPKVRVIAFLPLTDNQPGPTAQMPSDVIAYRNGTTVEVFNTDAEGRLILADGLCRAVEEKADAIIDVATLTGAITIALGDWIAGMYANHDALAAQLVAAAKVAGEELWRMPLADRYRKLLDSKVADVCNVAIPGGGGANIAALFLERFVDGRPWAHLDIAGPAFIKADDAEYPAGGTGFATRTLVELIAGFSKPR